MGIHFDISADNTDFINKVKQVQDSLRRADSIMQNVGKNFDTSSAQKQIASLNKLIGETRAALGNQVKELSNLQQEAFNAFSRGDTKQMEYFNSLINEQTKDIAVLTKELESYRETLATVEAGNNMTASTPQVVSPQLYADKAGYDKAQALREQQQALRDQISGFDYDLADTAGSDARLDGLYAKLGEVSAKLRETEAAAADAAAKLGAGLGEKAAEVSTELYELQNGIAKQKQAVAQLGKEAQEAGAKLDQLRNSGADVSEIEQARSEYDALIGSLTNAENELRNMQAAEVDVQKEWDSVSAQTNDHIASLRQQMRAVQQELATLTLQYGEMSAEEKNSAQGREMLAHINELTEKGGELRDAYGDAMTAMNNAASDTRTFDQIAGGVQVATDAFGLATAGAEIFGASEEDLVEMQTKLQAAFVASNAIMSIQNNLQRQSALMQGINIIQTKAAAVATNIKTAAEGKGIIVTKAAAVAQAVFNAVAKANPYVLLATALITVVGALWAFSKGSKQAAKETEEFQNTVADTASKPISKVEELSAAWKRLGDDMEAKQQFIKDHKKDFDELGVAIRSVEEAENLLIANKEAFIQAQYAKAEAEAYRQVATEQIKEQIQNKHKMESAEGFDFGDIVQTTKNAWESGLGFGAINLVRNYQDDYDAMREENEKLTAEIEENFQHAAEAAERGSDLLRNANIAAAEEAAEDTNAYVEYIATGSADIDSVLNDMADSVSEEYRKKLQQIKIETANFITTLKNSMLSLGGVFGGKFKGASLMDLFRSGASLLSAYYEAGKAKPKGWGTVDHRAQIAQQQIQKETAKLNKMRAANSTATNEEIRQQEALIKNMKNEYKTLTGNDYDRKPKARTRTHKTNTDKEVQEAAKAEREAAEQLEKLRDSNAQDEIKQMKDESKQRLAQIDFDYKERMDKIREQEKEFAELNKKRKAKGLNEQGLTTEQQTEITKAENLALDAQRQSLDEIKDLNAQYMLDYLKEYGSYQQQRLAIAQEYDKRIAESSNEWEKKSLQKQKQSALQSLEIAAIKQSIDWGSVFGDFGTMFESQLKPTIAKLEKITQSDEFKNETPENQKTLYDLLAKLRMSDTSWDSGIFKQVGEDLVAYQEAVKKHLEAQEREMQATEDLAAAQEKLKNAQENNLPTQSMYELIVKGAQSAYDTAAEDVKNFGGQVQDTTANLSASTEEMNNKLDTFVSSVSGLKSGSLQGVGESLMGFDKLFNKNAVTDEVGKALADGVTKLFGKDSQISESVSEALGDSGLLGALIGAALSIMDILKEGIGKLFSSLIDTVLGAISGMLKDILSGQFAVDIFNSVKDGFAGILDAITFGGFSSWFSKSNAKEVAETTDRLTAENVVLRKTASKLSDDIKNNYGAKSIAAGNEALEAKQKEIENQRDIARAQMSYYGAHSSNAHYWAEGKFYGWDSLNALIKEYNSKNDTNYGPASSLNDILNLPPEVLDYIRTWDPDLWRQMAEVGKYDDKWQAVDDLADMSGEMQEIEDAIKESLTGLTFDGLRDSFIDSLMDMDKSAEDFADDFEQYLMKAILSAQVSDLLGDDLKAFYDKWAEYSEDGLNQAEIEELKADYDDIVNKGIAIREDGAAITGYTGESAAEQRSTAGGYETMSEDTGQELNGRFTAIQDSNERIAQSVESSILAMQNLLVASTEGNATLNDILLQNVRTNDYLDDIKTYTKAMRGFGEKLDAIVTNTSKL